MRPVEQIALAEFVRSFGIRSGAPGARDFVSLSVFFALSSFLLFLGLAAHEGTRHRFEQVLLGALPASGPPVRLGAHIERPETLTPELLDQFTQTFPGLRDVPARDFDGQAGVLTLPGFEASDQPAQGAASSPAPDTTYCQRLNDLGHAWRCGADGSISDFRGLALPKESPIWRWVETQGAGKSMAAAGAEPIFVVAASRALFGKHFRYESYRKAIVDNIRVPCSVRQAVFAEQGKSPDFPTIVLRVRESRERIETYHVARVVWVDSFPVDRVAMVVPLANYEVLLAGEGRNEVSLHPELDRAGRRIARILLLDLDLESKGERERLGGAFRTFSTCLGAVEPGAAPAQSPPGQLSCSASLAAATAAGSATDATPILPRLSMTEADAILSVRPEWALRSAEVAACARRAGLGAEFGADPARQLPSPSPIRIEHAPESTLVRWKGYGRLEMPCGALGKDDLAGRPACPSGAHGEARLPGYRESFVYAGDDGTAAGEFPGEKGSLDVVVANLLNWKPDGRPVFRLDPAYEGALVRFGVLSTLLDLISLPIGIGAVLLYGFLTFVIMTTTFAHRRSQYGLLMMNGMRGSGVAWLVSCQTIMSAVVGGAFGLAFFGVSRSLVNGALAESTVVQTARRLIGLDMPIFVDLPSAMTFILAWVYLTALAVGVGNLTLLAQGITRARAPISLLKG